ncbi:MAG: hypothetical protein JNL74_23205 [Fibrobacteres bacterium]|nr:hypothetical protein [Fibrobacterota bacterium]
MKRKLIYSITALAVLLINAGCSDEPTGNDVPYLEIYAERTDFRGEAITFTAVFGEGINDSLIEWKHKGLEIYRASRNRRDTLIFADTVKIAWNNIKGGYTSTNNSDTVTVVFKNSGFASNQIVISLINHAPYLDSVKMGSVMVGSNHFGDTINRIRMALNPTVQETLKVYMRDEDGNDFLHTKFSFDNMRPALPAGSAGEFDSIWVFKAPVLIAESLDYMGKLRLSDGKGGNTYYPFEIIVYDEVHSVWVASTNGQISSLNKLDKRGRKLFSLPRFQQIKFLSVLPSDPNFGTEALWVVDRTKQSKTTSAFFCDTLFVLDDDGKFRYRWPLTGTSTTSFSLCKVKNVAFSANADTVRKITIPAGPKVDLALGSSNKIEALEADPVNDNVYWIGVVNTLDNRRYLLKVMNSAVVDTLRTVGGVVYDSIDRFTSIAFSPISNSLWIGSGYKVLRARSTNGMRDSLVVSFTGFHNPRIVADQRSVSPTAYIADEGNSKIKKIIGAAQNDVDIPNGLPRSLAFDYTKNPPRLWVADYGNNKVLAYEATLAPILQARPGEAELENPEAITVNTGTY